MGRWTAGREMDDVEAGGCTRTPRRRGSALGGTVATVLAAAALLTGASDRAIAQEYNRFFWDGCELNSNRDNIDTEAGLIGDLEDSGLGFSPDGDVQVAFVLVYSLEENDGQPVNLSGPGTGFTGPVLCLNGTDFAIAETTQTTAIPENVTKTADFLDFEEVSIIRYRLNPDGPIQKVLCHTVKSNSDCVLISPQ
jgi:hypothetical protein